MSPPQTIHTLKPHSQRTANLWEVICVCGVASFRIGCQVLMALNERHPRATLALSVNTGTQAEDDYLQTRKCLLPHNLTLHALGLRLSCLYTEAREPLYYSSPDGQDPLFPSLLPCAHPHTLHYSRCPRLSIEFHTRLHRWDQSEAALPSAYLCSK